MPNQDNIPQETIEPRLILSTEKASKFVGTTVPRFLDLMDTLGIRPIIETREKSDLEASSKKVHRYWSKPQILKRLENWDSPAESGTAPYSFPPARNLIEDYR